MSRRFVLALIDFYRKGISPLLPPVCRFTPSCSAYAYEVVERFGVWRGLPMVLRRLARCHPWAKTGLDPVPPARRGARPAWMIDA